MTGIQTITKSSLKNVELPEPGQSRHGQLTRQLAAKHPTVPYGDIIQLAFAIECNEQCPTDCDGSQCEKATDQWTVATYEEHADGFEVRWGDCPFKKKRVQRAKRLAGLAYADVPIRFRNITARDYQRTPGNERAVAAARSVLENGTGLFVYGAPGVGKSMLAAIIAAQAIARGNEVFYADVPTTLAAIRNGFSNPNADTSTTVERICNADLAVLDDLGAERPTSWAAEQLFRIINTRYNNETPTVATSNFDLKSLYNQMGGSYIASRICRRIFDTMTIVEITE